MLDLLTSSLKALAHSFEKAFTAIRPSSPFQACRCEASLVGRTVRRATRPGDLYDSEHATFLRTALRARRLVSVCRAAPDAARPGHGLRLRGLLAAARRAWRPGRRGNGPRTDPPRPAIPAARPPRAPGPGASGVGG